MKAKLEHLKVGDKVVRMLAGTIPLKMVVTEIKNSIITCMDEDKNKSIQSVREGARLVGAQLPENDDEIEAPNWTFSMNTGGEIDVELGYDGINTCSYIKEVEDEEKTA